MPIIPKTPYLASKNEKTNSNSLSLPLPNTRFSRNSESGIRGAYCYGFQAQEQDNEMWGGSVSFKYRVEDPRLGRFFSVDPLVKEYCWNSSFAFAENRVVDGRELEGKEWSSSTTVDQSTGKTIVNFHLDLKIVNASDNLDEAMINQLIESVKTDLMATFTQFDASTNTQYTISSDIQVVSGCDPNNGLSILLQNTGDPLLRGDSQLGETQNQMINIYTSRVDEKSGCSLDSYPINEISKTVVHELGHTLGLVHPHNELPNKPVLNDVFVASVAFRDQCSEGYLQYRKCIEYIRSNNPKAIKPDMSILSNFMMQGLAMQTLSDKGNNPETLDIDKRTGATIEQCKVAEETICNSTE